MTIFARSSIKITTGKSKSICREGRYDDSNYRDVKFICDRAETIEVPEEEFSADVNFEERACILDYSSSTRPECADYQTVTRSQINRYRIYLCSPWNYQCENPDQVFEQNIKSCSSANRDSHI